MRVQAGQSLLLLGLALGGAGCTLCEHEGPEAKGPEAKGPEAKGPEAKGPEAKGPEAKGPEAKGPEAKGPEAKGPEAKGQARVEPPTGASSFSAQLPGFELQDPTKRKYRSAVLRQHGLVLLASEPTVASGGQQEAWNEVLLAARPQDTQVTYAILENMAASWFKGPALARMKKEFDPKAPPLLLIDPKGEVTKTLSVKRGQTVVLVYSSSGALVAHETAAATAARAAELWRAAVE